MIIAGCGLNFESASASHDRCNNLLKDPRKPVLPTARPRLHGEHRPASRPADMPAARGSECLLLRKPVEPVAIEKCRQYSRLRVAYPANGAVRLDASSYFGIE